MLIIMSVLILFILIRIVSFENTLENIEKDVGDIKEKINEIKISSTTRRSTAGKKK